MSNTIRQTSSAACWHAASLIVASVATFTLGGCSSGGDAYTAEANINTQAAQIGGATTAVAYYDDGTSQWTLYNMADRFAATRIGMAKEVVSEIRAPGFIRHITVASYGGKKYALLAMGGKGIGVVDLASPGALTPAAYLRTMTVNYETPAYTYVDGGGTQFTAAPASHTSGAVNDLLVDDKGDADDSNDELFIANGAFGIQKTRLANLMAATKSGVLTIDGAQNWTLKYAGETPWGGPLSLRMHGGRLYVALGFLGIGIYNPDTLTREGAYNLYADCSNPAQEDWFGYPKRKIACPDAANPALVGVVAGGVDADGMPTYLQAGQELRNKNGLTWYPWAEFDRYGKYYYNARTMDVQVIGGKTLAFIAYSLGGLVAVDVSDPTNPVYEGYVPAAPAHGPDTPPINVNKRGILSHSGSGMLKEAGVIDVRVLPDPGDANKYRAYYTDHFGGLVVVSGAEAPGLQWRNAAFAGSNDTNPQTFWPDYEFVTSYDMTPVPVGDESMPRFLTASNGNYTAPVMLVTGEINGHGGALFLMPSMVADAAGQVDVVESSGAGGISYVDFIDLMTADVAVADRFAVPVNQVSTDEVGANEDGSPGQSIAIGHTEGVRVAGDFLYLADGPHGVSVWRIAYGGFPIDNPHLVANTLQSEYPTPGSLVMPTPHAFKVFFGNDPNQAYVMSQSLGMRRLDVSAVNSGSAKVGAPALLNAYGGIYEHSTESGNLGVKVTGQDHAFGVVFSGKYAIVADGDNGLTVYDTSVTPDLAGSHVVANIGDSDTTATGKPPLGRASSVKLWRDPSNGRQYAVVAAGAFGISVVDMTDFLASGQPADLGLDKLIKTFEPLKSDDDNAFGSADGKSVDVHVVGDIAYFSYDSFGLVAYRMADLIQPVTETRPPVAPAGQAPDACAAVTDVTKLSLKQGGIAECRPTAAGYFKLQKLPEYANLDGGALYMTPQLIQTYTYDRREPDATNLLPGMKLLFYVGYGDAGVVKLDWSDVTRPKLLAIKEVVGGAVGTAVKNNRVYVAASTGGLVVLK